MENSKINRNILDNSEYIISYFNNQGKEVTNLKLEKLMYFLEAIYMALTGEEYLYEEEFLAWDFGPVNQEVYNKYKSFGKDPITLDNPHVRINSQNEKYISTLFTLFKDFTAFDLVNLSHSEGSPWRLLNDKYNGKIDHNIKIDKDATKRWFSNIIMSSVEE